MEIYASLLCPTRPDSPPYAHLYAHLTYMPDITFPYASNFRLESQNSHKPLENVKCRALQGTSQLWLLEIKFGCLLALDPSFTSQISLR